MIGTKHRGYCPICEDQTEFYIGGEWLRDNYICTKCWSIPRQRAITVVLQMLFPEFRKLALHESSPDGANSKKFASICQNYSVSQFFVDTPYGKNKNGVRCENLECLTFRDQSFDIFITQDVFEHVLEPMKAFSEVARVIKPGGAHIFTLPYNRNGKTFVRAKKVKDTVEYLAPKEYHMNPIDPDGSLVITDWGNDLPHMIMEATGMNTAIYHIIDRNRGLDGEFLEVFVSHKI